MTQPVLVELEEIAHMISSGSTDESVLDYIQDVTSEVYEPAGRILVLQSAWSLLKYLNEVGRGDVVELLGHEKERQ